MTGSFLVVVPLTAFKGKWSIAKGHQGVHGYGFSARTGL